MKNEKNDKNGSGNRIREIREALGKSQEEVAALAGITQKYLSIMELEKVRCPSLAVARDIAKTLQTTVDELFPRPPQITVRGEAATRRVWLDDKELTPERSLKVVSHSPAGFAWGYKGSGPSQLALAIMLELTTRKSALELYQEFKLEILSRLDIDKDFEFVLPDRWARRVAGKEAA